MKKNKLLAKEKKEIEIAKKLYLKSINQKKPLKIICFI